MYVASNILIRKELETKYNHAAYFAGDHLPLSLFQKLGIIYRDRFKNKIHQ
jgi:hypothetical protein